MSAVDNGLVLEVTQSEKLSVNNGMAKSTLVRASSLWSIVYLPLGNIVFLLANSAVVLFVFMIEE